MHCQQSRVEVALFVEPVDRALTVPREHLGCLAIALAGVHVDLRPAFLCGAPHLLHQAVTDEIRALRAEEHADATVRCAMPAIEDTQVLHELSPTELWVEGIELARVVDALLRLANG